MLALLIYTNLVDENFNLVLNTLSAYEPEHGNPQFSESSAKDVTGSLINVSAAFCVPNT